MRFPLLALALALPAASSAEAPASTRGVQAKAPARICSDDLKVRPVRPGQGVRPQRLGELPPGDLTLTVISRVGDCIEPVRIRQGYGAVDRDRARSGQTGTVRIAGPAELGAPGAHPLDPGFGP